MATFTDRYNYVTNSAGPKTDWTSKERQEYLRKERSLMGWKRWDGYKYGD